MTKEIHDLLILLSIPAIFFGGIALGIYSLHKSCQLEERENKKYMEEAKEVLEEEKKKPKYRIRFIDSGREEHVTTAFDPRIYTNFYTRKLEEKFTISRSKDVADSALRAVYEMKYIQDVEGNTFPTCNLHKLFVEEVK